MGDDEVTLSRGSDVFLGFYSLQISHSTWCWTRGVWTHLRESQMSLKWQQKGSFLRFGFVFSFHGTGCVCVICFKRILKLAM